MQVLVGIACVLTFVWKYTWVSARVDVGLGLLDQLLEHGGLLDQLLEHGGLLDQLLEHGGLLLLYLELQKRRPFFNRKSSFFRGKSTSFLHFQYRIPHYPCISI